MEQIITMEQEAVNTLQPAQAALRLFSSGDRPGASQETSADTTDEYPIRPYQWTLLLICALLLTIWGFIEIGCLPGKAGLNRYGANPIR